jgi:hypothetical protein
VRRAGLSALRRGRRRHRHLRLQPAGPRARRSSDRHPAVRRRSPQPLPSYDRQRRRPHRRFTPPATPPTDPILSAPVKSRPQTAHILAHALEGQTLAAALEDSPAGLAAWIIHRRHTWSDTSDVAAWYGRDFILRLLSIYWYTRTSGTSFRKYQAMVFNAWEPAHDRSPVVEAPTAITFFDNDTGTSQSRFWVPDYYNVVRLGRSEVGGHFAPSEVPDVAAREIVATFELLAR